MATSETDVVDSILENTGPETDTNGLQKDDDGVAYDHKACSRWQEYGHDRLYFTGDSDGYIDLEDGGIVEDTPITRVEVEDNKVVYYATDLDDEYPIASRPL